MLLLSVLLLYDSRGVTSLYLSAIRVDQGLIKGTGRASVLAHSLVANPVVHIARTTDRASGLEPSQITRCNRSCQRVRAQSDHAVQPIVPVDCNPNGHAVFKEGLLMLPAVPMEWNSLGSRYRISNW